jgi:hypothetical protein
MADEEPMITLEVHKIYRADMIAFSLTIQNNTDQTLPAGIRVQVYGKRSGQQGAAEKPWFTKTTPEPLAPGESYDASSSGPMREAEVKMEFTARLADS